MTRVRRSALAAALTALAATALTAAPASGAPALDAPSCVGYQGNLRSLAVKGSGFTPGATVSLRYQSRHLGPEPRSAGLVEADATGAFSTTLVPPSPGSIRVRRSRFTLSAVDPLRPELGTPATTITTTRVRVSVRPRAATSARRRALYRAEGFEPGETVYAHFRGPGVRRARTVRLGRARGACGQVSKRMSLVPGRRVQRGSWSVSVDTERRWSPRTTPQARTAVIVQRRGARRR